MALITLSRAKEFLPNFDDSDDSILTNILSAASDLVERYLGRSIASAQRDELYNGRGNRTLLLENYPVISIERIATNPQPVLRVINSDTTNTRATVKVTSTGITIASVASGVTTSNDLAFADNTTLGDLKAAVNAVDGWTATVDGLYSTYASVDLRAIQGVLNARNVTCDLVLHVDELEQYRINEETGEIYHPFGFGRGYQNWRVIYTSGYSSTPEPIAQAIAEIAAATYKQRSHDPNLASESLGQYSYSLATEKAFSQLSHTARQGLALYKARRVPEWRTF